MLIIRYNGPEDADNGEKRLRLPANVDNIDEAYSFVEDELAKIPECRISL